MPSSEKRQAGENAIVGAIALAVAAAYYIGADHIHRSSLIGKGVGADTIPKALAIAMALLGIAMLVPNLLRWARLPRLAEVSRWRKDRFVHLRALGMLAIGIAFVAVLGTLGYIPSTILLLVATAVYIGGRFSFGVVLFALGITAVYYGLFVLLLGIHMPSGMWSNLWRSLTG